MTLRELADYKKNMDELNLKIDLAIEDVEKRIEELKQDNGLTMWE